MNCEVGEKNHGPATLVHLPASYCLVRHLWYVSDGLDSNLIGFIGGSGLQSTLAAGFGGHADRALALSRGCATPVSTGGAAAIGTVDRRTVHSISKHLGH